MFEGLGSSYLLPKLRSIFNVSYHVVVCLFKSKCSKKKPFCFEPLVGDMRFALVADDNGANHSIPLAADLGGFRHSVNLSNTAIASSVRLEGMHAP